MLLVIAIATIGTTVGIGTATQQAYAAVSRNEHTICTDSGGCTESVTTSSGNSLPWIEKERIYIEGFLRTLKINRYIDIKSMVK